MIRLGEASARIRLSRKITLDDAQRAKRIVDSCLKKIGVDPDTGLLDADIIATGMAKSTRERTKTVIDLIREVSVEHQGSAPRDEVLDRAEKMGIERERVDAIIDRLRRDGEVFDPKPGMLRMS